MKLYILRNSTSESLFAGLDAIYSGYNDISNIDFSADMFVWFYLPPFKTGQKTADEITSYLSSLQFVIDQIPEHKLFLVFTLDNIFDIRFQNSDRSLSDAISAFNMSLSDFAKSHSNIRIIDFSGFTRDYSLSQLIDWKYYFISGMQINPHLARDFRQWFRKKLEAIQLKRKKCIVLDLDNTLWGGVLGEDGIAGIKIDGDYPGNVFLMFRNFLLELGRNGVILTICSKNNEQDVLDLWEQNPYMVLKSDNIAAYRINWNNKALNISELADELNIGLDSMVFIDDNPAERELVRQALPMVSVPEFPPQPYLLPEFMKYLITEYFDTYTLTEEDLKKETQYKANANRSREQQKFIDFSEYLKSLDIELIIETANSFNIPRIAQLTQKTNQFNLTTHRYMESDISQFIQSEALVYCLSVKDKFGDDGITGVAIFKKTNLETYEIDTFLLSCRILGKNIEKAFLYSVLNRIKTYGNKTVYAKYIPTNKNMQVENFYTNTGFEKISSNEDNSIDFYLELTDDFETDPVFKITSII